MGYGRAHMKDEAFRAVIEYKDRKGDASVRIIGPYATAGAARGQATANSHSLTRWGDANVSQVTIQRATGWEDVE